MKRKRQQARPAKQKKKSVPHVATDGKVRIHLFLNRETVRRIDSLARKFGLNRSLLINLWLPGELDKIKTLKVQSPKITAIRRK